MMARRLTDGQRALWFLHELAPTSSKYIIARAALIRGPLDTGLLERAVHAVGGRHPALRTTFDASAGAPQRTVHAPRDIAIDLVDASGLDDGELAARLRTAAYQPFDLQRGPLWRMSVLARSATEHLLLFAMHHIVTDFWSLTLVFDEVRRLYEAGVAAGPEGIARALSALPLAGDPEAYLRMVDDYLASPARDADLAWWRGQLDGAPVELDWPTTGSAPAAGDAIPQLAFTLPGELRDRVEAFGRARGATMHPVLLAAYDVLLARWTGQRDLVVGVPSAVRRGPEVRRLVGYCVNPLPLRARLAEHTTFAELVAQASATTRGALRHQRLPFAALVEHLGAQRPAGNPIFQAMFSFQRAFAPELEALAEFAIGAGTTELRLGPATIRAYPLAPSDPQVDLTLSVAPVAAGLACTLDYDPAQFERGAIEQMASQYERLLDQLIEAPDRPVACGSLVSETERPALARAWNDTARDYPRHARLHELVSARVRERPDAVAVVDGRTRLTYAELEARADRLSRLLRARGVRVETRVGVLMNRTTDLIVALLAVLDSGGVYVPLDPAYPAKRLEFCARDAGIHLLVTERALAGRLLLADGERIVMDDGALLDDDGALPAAPPVALHPDALAYILYTSGSTGNPKGVCVTHRNAVNFVHWAATAFSDRDMAEVLASTSICFDLSVFEIYATLYRGGRVVLVDNALAVADQAHARTVTLINTVPSALSALVATGGVPDSVRVVIVAGEPLHASLVHQAYANTAAQRVFNYYGPTEATTYATGTAIARDAAGAPSIGLPLDNTRAYVLDRELEPLPAGMRGDLYVGGDGVTRGYAGQPALTAERFVPDPFAAAPGARMYRTGDVAVRRGDGQLHFVGRADQQIKLRGFRIELGEIESCLLSCPAVREACVSLWTGREEPRLVAHVVTAGARREITDDALQRHLRESLPDYMVPAQFVRCVELPHTPSGKIDRARLPDPGAPAPAERHVTARDELEARIAAAWSEALAREPIGVHDNFFALGGSSLVAVRLVALLRHRGVPVALRDLFAHPSVAALAALLRADGPHRTACADDAVPVLPRVPFRLARPTHPRIAKES